MMEAEVLSHFLKSPVTDIDSPAVTPDYRGTQHFPVTVHSDQSVHLVRNTYCSDGIFPLPERTKTGSYCHLQVGPPHFRILFSPSGRRCLNWHFGFGVKGRGN